MGAPLIELDEIQIELMSKVGCTVEQIAKFLGVSSRTLFRRFGTAIEKGHAAMCLGIRQDQLLSSQRGNATMQIWLGKQFLGQKDKHETEHTGEVKLTFNPIVQAAALTDPQIRADALALDERIEQLRITHESNAAVDPGENGD